MEFGLSLKKNNNRTPFVLLFLCFAYIVSGQPADSVYFTVSNLFYCNSYHPISKLWILNDSTAIGARRFNSEENHIRDVVLISRSGLILDSLNLAAVFKAPRDYTFQQVQHITPQENSTILIHSGRFLIPVSVRDSRFTLLDTTLVQKRKDVYSVLYNHHQALTAEFVLYYKNLLIGYDRRKVKARNDRVMHADMHDEKNYPLFWIIDVNDTGFKKQYINQAEDVQTNSLYFDVKDWNQTWSRSDVYEPYISVYGNLIYFSVPRANKCYVYNITTGATTKILFPVVNKNESCHFFTDYLSKKEYAIKRTANNHFTVYQYSDDHTRVYAVKTFTKRPFAIVGNRAHFVREIREDRKTVLCHYLVPLWTEESKLKQILPEIIIRD